MSFLRKTKSSKNKRTIIHVIDLCPKKLGSFEEYIISTSNRSTNNNDNVILVFACEIPEIFKSYYRKFDVYCLFYHKNKLKFFLSLAKLFMFYRPNIVHYSFFPIFSFLTIYTKLFGIKYIIHSDRLSAPGDLSTHKGIKKLLVWIRNKLASMAIYKIICVSNYVYNRDLNITGLNHKKLVMIHNGINTQRFSKQTNNNSLRQYGNISKSDFLVTIAAGMRKEKGIHLIIEAAYILKPRFPNLKYWIIGDGPYRDVLQSLSNKLDLTNTLFFLGEKDNIQEYLSESNLFVYPSMAEAFGFSIAEAMSCSLPVIGTNVGGIPELIDNNITGILIPPNDSDALAKAIESLATNVEVCKRMGELGRIRATSKFSLQRMTNEYLEIYERL